jgi:Ca2+-binding EF-hand superfamily protein
MRITAPDNNILSSLDENDILESFDVLDVGKTGTITMGAFETLWLGLGYGKIEMTELEMLVRDEQVKCNTHGDLTVNLVLRILSKVR